MYVRNLYQRLHPWIAAPHFEDEDKTRIASLINLMLLAFAALVTLDAVSNLILQSTDTVFYVSVDAVLFAALLGLRAAVRRGYVRGAAFLLCFTTWLMLTIGTYPADGVADPYFPAFIIVILAAGLLLDGRMAAFFALLSSASGFLSVVGKHDHQDVLLQTWTGFTLIFAATAFMLYLADRSIRQAFARARRVEQILRENNARLEQEIRERHEVELALRAAEDFLTRLMENTPALITVITTDGRFRLINHTWEKMTRRTRDEVLGHRVEEVFSEDFARQIYRAIQPVLDRPETSIDEQEVQLANGEILRLYNCKFPLFDDEGKLSAVGIVSVDMTETRRAQETLLRTEMQRVELEKEKQLLRLKESFISMASHEFRGPLAVIQTSKEILRNYYDRLSEEKRQEHFERIDAQIRFMNTMLEDLLTLSKASAGVLEFNPQPMDLRAFCEALLAELRETDAHRHDLRLQAVNNPKGDFIGDEKLLRHILRNLLTNAIKYSPANAPVELKLRADGEEVVLQVSDHGIGIPEEDQQKLFEAFHRARNVRDISGTGLGLAIVRNSVEVHQGRISFCSKENQGTTFTVRLPMSPSVETAALIQPRTRV